MVRATGAFRVVRRPAGALPLAVVAVILWTSLAPAAENRPDLDPIQPSLGKETIPADMPAELRRLVEQLYSSDQYVCVAAAQALGEMGPKAVPAAPFLASLLDGHWAQPAPNGAAEALLRIGKGAFDSAAAAVAGTGEEARRRALLVMARLDGPRTIPVAVDMLATGTGGDFCLGALRVIGEPARDYVFRAATSPDAARRRDAVLALPAFSSGGLRYRDISGYGAGDRAQGAWRRTQAVVDMLTEAMGDRDEGVRLAAIGSLVKVSGCRDKQMPLGESLRAALKDANPAIRLAAITLALAADEADAAKFDALAPLMNDADPDVRVAAAAALENLPGGQGRGADLLVGLLKDPVDAVRERAALALGKMRASEAEGPLLKALEDPSAPVRTAAALALGRCGGNAGIEALMRLAKTDDAWLSFQAVLALTERWLDIRGVSWSNRLMFRMLGSEHWEARSGLRPLPPSLRGPFPHDRVRSLMVEVLEGPDRALHAVAAEALIEGLPDGDVPDSVLLAALNSPEKMAWYVALLHLEQSRSVPDERLVGAIRRAADKGGGWPGVDGMALAVLARIGDAETVLRHCKRLLGNSYSKVACGAARFLAALGEPGLGLMLNHLGDPREDVRDSMAHALARQADHPRVRAFVESALKSDSDALRQGAQQVMALTRKQTAPRAVVEAELRAAMAGGADGWRAHLRQVDMTAARIAKALLQDSDSNVRAAAADILAESGDPSAAPALRKALADDSAPVRARAIEALAALGDRAAVAALIAALDDGAEAVRAAAAAALGRLGDPAAIGPLAKALGRPDWHLRRAAAEALGSFADPRAAEALTKALAEDPHWAVRAAAATALGRRKEAAAVPPLLAGLADGHWYVRRAAHGALTVVTGQDLPADGGAWQTWWAGQTGPSAAPAQKE